MRCLLFNKTQDVCRCDGGGGGGGIDGCDDLETLLGASIMFDFFLLVSSACFCTKVVGFVVSYFLFNSDRLSSLSSCDRSISKTPLKLGTGSGFNDFSATVDSGVNIVDFLKYQIKDQ